MTGAIHRATCLRQGTATCRRSTVQPGTETCCWSWSAPTSAAGPRSIARKLRLQCTRQTSLWCNTCQVPMSSMWRRAARQCVGVVAVLDLTILHGWLGAVAGKKWCAAGRAVLSVKVPHNRTGCHYMCCCVLMLKQPSCGEGLNPHRVLHLQDGSCQCLVNAHDC